MKKRLNTRRPKTLDVKRIYVKQKSVKFPDVFVSCIMSSDVIWCLVHLRSLKSQSGKVWKVEVSNVCFEVQIVKYVSIHTQLSDMNKVFNIFLSLFIYMDMAHCRSSNKFFGFIGGLLKFNQLSHVLVQSTTVH